MTSRFFSHLATGKRFAFFGFGMAAMMLPGVLSAAVSGSFGMSPVAGADGIVAYATTSLGPYYIDFCPENTATPGFSGCTVVNNGQGQFDVTGGTGSFSVLPKKGASATIDDISSSLSPPYTTMPVGALVSINNFITISGHPEWNFRATQFVNLTCTPPTSTQVCVNGFELGQVGSNVTVTVVFTGTLIASDGSTGTWDATITAQYTNTTMLAVATGATLPAGVFSNAWSGTVTVTLNQPSTFTGCTVTQGGWGAPPHGNNPGAFLKANFPVGGVTVGLYPTITDPGSFWLHFSSAVSIQNFLPQGGPPGALNASALNPTLRTSAGVFAGQVLALQLNSQLEGLGSLTLSGTGTSLDNVTVALILADANLALSGGALPSGFTYSSFNDLIDSLNSSFDGCVASGFGHTNLH